MAKKHGEASREVQDMSISLTTAQTKLNKLQKELDDNEKAAKDFGKAVEKNVEKEAKDAGKAVDSLGDELSGLDGKLGGIEGALDGLRNLTGIDLGMDLFGQVPDWVNQVLEWGDEGREYARGQARFEQVAEWAGIDPEEANAQLDRAAAIFGDREETRTGIQQLLNIKGLKSEDLPVILDNLIGAALANSDLSFEGITSDFQESVSSGELSGQFAEMLSRGGMTATDIEAVKTELESGKTQRERLITLLTALSKIEYEDKETGERRQSLLLV